MATTRVVTRLVGLAVICLAGCGREGTPPATDGPAAAGTPPSAARTASIRFEDVTAAAGITFRHDFGGSKFDNIVKSVGSGVAVLDYDGDGRMDLYFAGGGYDPEVTGDAKPAGAPPAAALYRNNGDGTFSDVAVAAGVADPGACAFGAAAADYDGDGRTDLYVCTYRANRLWHNDGNGKFTDVAATAGVAGSSWSVHAVWLDFDLDGRLDLYVVDYLTFDPSYRVFYAPEGFPGPLSYAGAADVLYRNRGDGTFEDVTKAAGVFAPGGRGMSAIAGDFDADGYPDVFVANDAMENFFWHNQRDGTFRNVAVENGTAYGLNGESTSAMGPAAADYDRDGWLDLFVPDTAFSCLYTHRGTGAGGDGSAAAVFRDRSAQAHVAQAGGQSVGWGGVFLDADNDGWPDLFRSSGNDHHLFGEASMCLHNRGDGTFEDVSRTAGEFFLRKYVGRAATTVDLDGDGGMDLVMTTVDAAPVLLRNRGGEGRHWIAFELVGDPSRGGARKSTRSAIGARVRVTSASGTSFDEVRAGSGYLSSADPRPHFGLGADAGPVSVEIRWPSGTRQNLTAVAPDRIVRVEEPARAPSEER